MKRTPFAEVPLWAEHFVEKPNQFNPLFYYLATICALLGDIPARVWGKGKAIEPEKWLIKFTHKKAEALNETEADREKRIYDQGIAMKKSLVGALKAAAKANKSKLPAALKAKLAAKEGKVQGKKPSDSRKARKQHGQAKTAPQRKG